MLSVYEAVCIKVKSPDGSMIVNFAEENGQPKRVEIYIGKAGTTLRAWATSFAEVVSIGLENGADLDDFCNVLFNQSSDKNTQDVSGITVSSGPEAFALAILKYKLYKQSHPSAVFDVGRFSNPKRKNLGS